MNVVIDEAAEVYVKDAKPRRELGEISPLTCVDILLTTAKGRILLKGDNITLIQQVV
jgi:small nuclear ribonucleoprotein (snRNP)-like protein